MLENAKEIITSNKATCVVFSDKEILYTGEGRGVAPLIFLYEHKKELLVGNSVADKIIGKGAAMILHLGGAKFVYGELMSQPAKDYLDSHGITCAYGKCVGIIKNRENTGICPIENSVLEISDPNEGYSEIKKTIDILMNRNSAS